MNNKDKKNEANQVFKQLAEGKEFVYMPPVRPSHKHRAILRMLRDALPPEVWERITKKHGDLMAREPFEIAKFDKPLRITSDLKRGPWEK